MEQAIDHCSEILREASKSGWDNLQWPPGWSLEYYKKVRSYCLDKLEKHREGRMARILGGPKQHAAFNAWLCEALELLQETEHA
jgi:hypothetical protein